ncbi:MAG: hypothetical protein H6728_02455 [Myxococcales bacterium]|nr:hypothetical protein [Myxococcales bacterium]MCB9641916.1 hypothetical protein [Myxococcales bacterium]
MSGTSPSQERWRARLLLAAVFLLVGCGIVIELLIAGYASHLQGDSIYQFSLTIGLFMSAMGVGSFFTQRFEGRLVERMAWVQWSFAASSAVTILFLGLSDQLTTNFSLLCHAWTVWMGGHLGFALPLAVRIVESDLPLPKLLASVLFMDYLGALAGSLWFPWWLLPTLGFANGVLAVALIVLLGLGLLALGFWQQLKHERVLWWSTITLLGVIALSWGRVERVLETMTMRGLAGAKKVYVARSRYQEIRFLRYDKSYFLSLNRFPQFSSQDEHRYHESLVHLAMHRAKKQKRVLILGGGDGLALRELWRYADIEKVVMVDLDPAMTGFGRDNPVMRRLNEDAMQPPKPRTYCIYEKVCDNGNPSTSRPTSSTATSSPSSLPHTTNARHRLYQQRLQHATAACPALPLHKQPQEPSCRVVVRKQQSHPKLEVRNEDAWKYVEQTKERFDVILSDLPDATNIALSKLYSLEFYRMLRRLLASGGAMAVQSTAVAPSYRRAFWCIYNTIETAGFHTQAYRAWIPSFGLHTSFVLASDAEVGLKAMDFTIPTRFLHDRFLPAMLWFPKDISRVKTRINHIDTHILLRYLLKNSL